MEETKWLILYLMEFLAANQSEGTAAPFWPLEGGTRNIIIVKLELQHLS